MVNKKTTLTLLDQIQYAQRKQAEIEQRLADQRHLVNELLALRKECAHDFEPAIPGYEHEGGTCKLCGINELYAHTLKQQQQKQI